MQLTEFKFKYQLNCLPLHPLAPHKSNLTKAAVLIPIININNEAQVILTQRPLHLKHHPGQISFPGGKYEQQDQNLLVTALRESKEEIGLAPERVQILGQLPKHNTLTGFSIYPFIGVVTQPFYPTLNRNEVEDYFTVPLSFILNKQSWHQKTVNIRGHRRTLYFINFDGRLIWGATAAILNMLHQQLTH